MERREERVRPSLRREKEKNACRTLFFFFPESLHIYRPKGVFVNLRKCPFYKGKTVKTTDSSFST